VRSASKAGSTGRVLRTRRLTKTLGAAEMLYKCSKSLLLSNPTIAGEFKNYPEFQEQQRG
jgi:hypothetical protein